LSCFRLPEIDREEEEMARRAQQVEEPSVQPAQRDEDRPQFEAPTLQAESACISQRPSIPTPVPQPDGGARERRLQVIQQVLGKERSSESGPAKPFAGGVINASPLLSNVAPQRMTQQAIGRGASSTADIEESIDFDDDFDFDEAALQQIDEVVAKADSAQSGVKAKVTSVLDINSDDDDVPGTNYPSYAQKQSKESRFTAEIIDLSD